MPIGISSSYSFDGCYDGGNFNISNCYISSNDLSYVGLFGSTNSRGSPVIENINMINASIASSYAHAAVGGIVGDAGISSTIIYNCSISGKVESSNAVYNGGSGMTGGIIGCAHDGSVIEKCVNYAEIRANYAGGIAGNASTTSLQAQKIYIRNCENFGDIIGITIEGSYTSPKSASGGIVAKTGNYAEIENCHNYGEVKGGEWASGIAASISYINYPVRIYNCSNSGSVVSIGLYAGGIAAYGKNTIIEGCFNLGNIKSESEEGCTIGGIIARPSGNAKITNCYNSGDILNYQGEISGGIVGTGGIVNFCYNKASIVSLSYAGGIVGCYNFGFESDGNISNSYNVGDIIGGENSGGILGYGRSYNSLSYCYNSGNVSNGQEIVGGGSADIVNCETFNTNNAKDLDWYLTPELWSEVWDFETIWTFVSGVNDDMPILSYQLANSYSITYHPNGASGNEVVESKTGSESYTIRSNMFTRSGYNFTGWNTEANGGGQSYSAGSSYSGLANLDLYAQWSRITYTITYNKNASDATGSMANTTKYYGTNVTLRSNGFKRTGYSFAGWATSSGGAVVYANGATYSANASVTLYAKWTAHKYTVKFNGNGSTSGSMSNQTFTYGTAQKLTSNAFKKTGFTFSKWTRNADGTGTSYTNGQSVKNLTSTNGAEINLYAQWTARNEAKYDSAGKYWYIENGKIPQTKVTNSTLISNLNKATTNGANYYIAGQTLTAKVYSGKEYCKWNNNWYEVEPIRWRLTKNSNQKDGYGTTTDTNAVLAEIVYVDQYSSSSIDAGEGYSNQSVTDFMRNGISTTYLVNYTTSTQTFGTGASLYGTNASTTARMFVSSQSEINAVNGTMNMTFSDLVEDMIKYYGGTNVYFTRDLGSNYNNIVCFNEVGREVQRFATDYRGVQFTVRFTEYGCVN